MITPDEQEMEPLQSSYGAYLDAVRRLFEACPPEDPALRARITAMLQEECPSGDAP